MKTPAGAHIVVDPDELAELYADDPAAHVYALVDLVEPFWSASTWYRRGDAVVGVVAMPSGEGSAVYAVSTRDPAGCLALLAEPEADGEYVPKNYMEMWFTGDIDNFSYLNHTFPLRYYIKTEYWNETGPIFFYCGNEGDINMFLNNSGYIDYLGQQMNALIVFAEHRYFGKSLPYGIKSFSAEKYRRYLSPHQALADFARLLNYLKDQHNNAPVIAWGGSYGGMLAAWFRIKYPNIVHGAIAASAPINHFYGIVDYFLFNEIITNDFAEARSTCPGLIQDGFTRIKQHSMNSTKSFVNARSLNT